MSTILTKSPPPESSSRYVPSHTTPDPSMPSMPHFHRHNSNNHYHHHLLQPYIPTPPVSTQQSSLAESQFHRLAQWSIPSHPGYITSGFPVASPDSTPRTLWMGDLDPSVTQDDIVTLWHKVMGKKVKVKVIVPRAVTSTGLKSGLASVYCFVEFELSADANQALQLNGLILPDETLSIQSDNNNNNTTSGYHRKFFRLNWAASATLDAPIVDTPEYLLFVGDLTASTTEAHLLAYFQNTFPNSIKTVRVMTDPVTGKSRCFGFVRFIDELSRLQALDCLQGSWLGGRQIRLALATRRKPVPLSRDHVAVYHGYPPLDGYYFSNQYGNQFGGYNGHLGGYGHLKGHNGHYYQQSNQFGHPSAQFRTFGTHGTQFNHYDSNLYNPEPELNANRKLELSEEILLEISEGTLGIKGISLDLEGPKDEIDDSEKSKGINSEEPKSIKTIDIDTSKSSSTKVSENEDSKGQSVNALHVYGATTDVTTSGGDKGHFNVGPMKFLSPLEPCCDTYLPLSVEIGQYYDVPEPMNSTGPSPSTANPPNLTLDEQLNQHQHQQLHAGGFVPPNSSSPQKSTTLFVGGLVTEVTHEMLLDSFKEYGTIVEIKVPPNKNCGFIKYSTILETEDALENMQGHMVGGNRVRLGWGRPSRRKE